MTNFDVLTKVIATLENNDTFSAEEIEKLQNIANSYGKRRAKSPAKVEAENNFKNLLVDTIAAQDAPISAGDLAKALNFEYTTQKISSALSVLASEGRVVKKQNKRKFVYSIGD